VRITPHPNSSFLWFRIQDWLECSRRNVLSGEGARAHQSANRSPRRHPHAPLLSMKSIAQQNQRGRGGRTLLCDHGTAPRGRRGAVVSGSSGFQARSRCWPGSARGTGRPGADPIDPPGSRPWCSRIICTNANPNPMPALNACVQGVVAPSSSNWASVQWPRVSCVMPMPLPRLREQVERRPGGSE